MHRLINVNTLNFQLAWISSRDMKLELTSPVVQLFLDAIMNNGYAYTQSDIC